MEERFPMIQVIHIHKNDILYKDEEGNIQVTTEKDNPQIQEALQEYYEKKE